MRNMKLFDVTSTGYINWKWNRLHSLGYICLMYSLYLSDTCKSLSVVCVYIKEKEKEKHDL